MMHGETKEEWIRKIARAWEEMRKQGLVRIVRYTDGDKERLVYAMTEKGRRLQDRERILAQALHEMRTSSLTSSFEVDVCEVIAKIINQRRAEKRRDDCDDWDELDKAVNSALHKIYDYALCRGVEPTYRELTGAQNELRTYANHMLRTYANYVRRQGSVSGSHGDSRSGGGTCHSRRRRSGRLRVRGVRRRLGQVRGLTRG
jgi:DNA-binding PadR family transcriptional regulator